MAGDFQLPPDKAIALLGRLMLSWDGQWFLKTAEACGLDTAVALNARVRASFGRIEIREFLKAKGHPGAATVEEAVGLVHEYQRLFLGEGIAADIEVDGEQVSVRSEQVRPPERCREGGPQTRYALRGLRYGLDGVVRDGHARQPLGDGSAGRHGPRGALLPDHP